MDELKVGIIGGSGMGEALLAQTEGTRHEIDTPFGPPSDAIIETEWSDVPVLFLSRHGRGHLLNPAQVPYRANIFALKQLGCTHVIATGAVGSLREEMKPRGLAVPDQIIDKTNQRPGTFYERAAVHVEFAEPFCPVLRQLLLEAARGRGEDGGLKMEDGKAEVASLPSSILHPPSALPFDVHDRGCYVAMEGPGFSSRAESLMHRLWGGDLIGMTAMPEAKLAREAELSYALVALVTDYDCWRQKPATGAGGAATAKTSDAKPAERVDPFLLLEEIIANLRAASENAVALIRRSIELMGARREELMSAASRQSLRLAIWSDKGQIAPEEIERLRPLWGRYFDGSL